MPKSFITILFAVASVAMSGCVAAYVGGKVVGAAVDVTTGAVSATAHGVVATGRAVGGLITGGEDDCEAEGRNDDESCADGGPEQ